VLASATTAPAPPQRKKRALRSYLAMLFGVARWQLIGVLTLTAPGEEGGGTIQTKSPSPPPHYLSNTLSVFQTGGRLPRCVPQAA
jgi:hypothetical protein